MTIDSGKICDILSAAHAEGRHNLFEHECYDVFQAIGAEAAPASRLVGPNEHPSAADLEQLSGDRVVLKAISPDITHKTEARGVRIVAREIGAVEAAFGLMLREVPETYAKYLENHQGEMPPGLVGRRGRSLEQHLAGRLTGILLCSCVTPDSHGFATELFVGIRATSEFGPIISAGLGGVEMELLARQTRKGAAVAIAPTGTMDGEQFFELFRRTLSYERLSGSMRGSRRLIDDATLVRCFQAFIDLANHFSVMNPEAVFHLQEVEVNPFVATGGRLAPLDGVCRFEPAVAQAVSRPVHKLANLLNPASAAVVGVSERSQNLGRIILANMLTAGFPQERLRIVHPQADSIDGVSCVHSVHELTDRVDLLVAAVGAHEIASLVDEVVEHDKANTVILIPGGIGEKQGSGLLESRLRQRIREAHQRTDGGPLVMGGNSLGVISRPGCYDTMFIPPRKLPKDPGAATQPLCFISQSGAFIVSTLSDEPWLNPAYALSIGNQIDLTAGDLIAHLVDDPGIDVFAVYMEGFRPGDGYAFAGAVKQAVANGKEVVFYKAGRTSEGRLATAGHTASVAGDYAVCENAMRQAGALVAHDFGEFSDLLRLALMLGDKEIAGNRIAAVSNAGFEAVGMADSIRTNGAELVLPAFSGRSEEALAKILADNHLDRLVDVRNPLDVTPMTGDMAYADIVAEVLSDPGIDAAIVGIVPLTPALHTLPPGDGHDESLFLADSIAQRLPRVAAASEKPVVAVVDAGPLFDPFADALRAGGLPVFRSADRAVRALCCWLDRHPF
jgi:acyl-CoA synthetase (NDP forming)